MYRGKVCLLIGNGNGNQKMEMNDVFTIYMRGEMGIKMTSPT